MKTNHHSNVLNASKTIHIYLVILNQALVVNQAEGVFLFKMQKHKV